MAASTSAEREPVLPPEILLHLFSRFVPWRDVVTCSGVSREWRGAALDASVWGAQLRGAGKVRAAGGRHARSVLARLAGRSVGGAAGGGEGLPGAFPDDAADGDSWPDGDADDGLSENVPLLRLPGAGDDSALAAGMDAALERCRAGLPVRLAASPQIGDPLRAFRNLALLSSLGPVLAAQVPLRGVAASSADGPTQGIAQALDGARRTFWSSTGTAEERLSTRDASEHLVFAFASPHVVRRVEITPFQAVFQRGAPCYPPLAVSVGLLGTEPLNPWPDQSLNLVYLSPPLPVPPYPLPFVIDIPPLFLPARGLVLLLYGKRTPQPSDNLYYTVLQSVRAFGIDVGAVAVRGGWYEELPLAGEEGDMRDGPVTPPPALLSALSERADADTVRRYLDAADYDSLSAFLLSKPVSHPLRGPRTLSVLVARSAALAECTAADVASAMERLASSASAGTTALFDRPDPARTHLRALRRLLHLRLSPPLGRPEPLSPAESVFLAASCAPWPTQRAEPLPSALRHGLLPPSPELAWAFVRGGHLSPAAACFAACDCADMLAHCLCEAGMWREACACAEDTAESAEGAAGSVLGMLRGVAEDVGRMGRGERRGWGVDWEGGARVQMGEMAPLAAGPWPDRPARTAGAALAFAAEAVARWPAAAAGAVDALGLPDGVAVRVLALGEARMAPSLRLAARLADAGREDAVGDALRSLAQGEEEEAPWGGEEVD
ncbi:hypothetical protein DFJ74DRAFT_768489 [Hyaloraphidium curvatum]|nr:hypothetical protein DFJ74DRAFT_768489 [Hyaloraphidium curvatum]